MNLIQGTSYKKVVTTLVDNVYNVQPFDLNGNVIREVTIEVDSTLNVALILLPLISSLKGIDIKINVIALTGSINPVTVAVAQPTNKIGASYDVTLVSDGASIELNPISATGWYGVPADVQAVAGASLFPYNLEWTYDNAIQPTYTYFPTWKLRSPLAIQMNDEIFTAENSLFNVPATLVNNQMSAYNATTIDFPTIEQFEGTVTMSPGTAQFRFQGVESFNFDSLKMAMGTFDFQSISSLANISFPSLEYAEYFNIQYLSQSSINLPKLRGGYLNLYNMNNLTTLSLPEFVIGNINFNTSLVTTVTLPKVKNLSLYLANTPSLTDIKTPLLEIVNQFYVSDCPLVTKLDTANIKFMYRFGMRNMPITKLDFPKIEMIMDSLYLDSTNGLILSEFTLGDTLKQYGRGGMSATGLQMTTGLNQASVDNILVRLASLDGTNGTTLLNNRSINLAGANASPSATGLTAKATLISRSCSVVTN